MHYVYITIDHFHTPSSHQQPTAGYFTRLYVASIHFPSTDQSPPTFTGLIGGEMDNQSFWRALGTHTLAVAGHACVVV
jgi:hypothetical protein